MAGMIVALAVVIGAFAIRGAGRQQARSSARRRLMARRARGVPAAVAARWRQRREVRQLVDELPAVLEEVARALRAGSSLRQACHDAAVGSGPARRSLLATVARAERGTALPAAFRSWADSSAVAEVRIAAGALALAATAGGPQARAVDGVALTLRERRAAAAEVRTYSAQARLSAVVIGVLPVAFLVWAAVTDRRTIIFLVGAPAGWACLAVGMLLEALGALWMMRILRGVAP